MAEGINLKMKMTGANKVQRELKQTGKAASGMGKKMQVTGNAAGALGGNMGGLGTVLKAGPTLMNPYTAAIAVAAAGLVAAAVAAKLTADAFVGMIKETFDLADQLDEIAKKSRSIGASAEDVQLLQGAFALNGVESDQLTKSLQKLNQGMGEALKGTSSYTDAFAALNLTAAELEGMPIRERMLAIAGGMDELGSKARQAQVAALLFGRAGKDMLVAFEEGGASLEAAIADIERFGVASNESVRNAEEMNDSVLRMERAFFGLKVEALAPIMPVLGGVADGIAEILVGIDKEEVRAFGEAFADGMVIAINGLFGLAKAHSVFWALARPIWTAMRAEIAGMNFHFIESAKLFAQAAKEATQVGKGTAEAMSALNEAQSTMLDSIQKARDAASEVFTDDSIDSAIEMASAVSEAADEYEKLSAALAKAADEYELLGLSARERLEVQREDAKVLAWYRATLLDTVASYEQYSRDMANIDKRFDVGLSRLRSKKSQVDPLADLKAQLKAFKREEQAALDSFKTKEQLLDEHLAARLLAIAEFRDAGLIGAQAAMSMELAFAAEHDAALLAIEEKRWKKIRAMRTSFYTSIRAQGGKMYEQLDEASAAFKDAQARAQADVIASIGTVAQQIGSVISSLSDDQNEEAKTAAKVLFGVSQAASLANAIVATAEAVTKTMGTFGMPAAIPFMAAAVAVGAAQIATIAGTTITGLADAGLPPGALRQAGLNRHTVLAVRNDEMVLDPVGTQAISRMLQQQAGGGQPIQVNTTLEIDGDVLGRTVDSHLIRSSERGHRYQDRIRY